MIQSWSIVCSQHLPCQCSLFALASRLIFSNEASAAPARRVIDNKHSTNMRGSEHDLSSWVNAHTDKRLRSSSVQRRSSVCSQHPPCPRASPAPPRASPPS